MRTIIVQMFLFAGIAAAASAATNGWTPVGPQGGSTEISVVASAPSVLWLRGGQTGGVYRSTNGAASWGQLDSLPQSAIRSRVGAAPSNANVAWVSTIGGVYKTIDGGTSWVFAAGVDQVLPVVDQDDPNIVYLAPQGSAALLRTVNGGGSFVSLAALVSVEDLILEPGPSQVMFVADSSGIQKSLDGGATFSPANSGLPAGPFIHDLEMDPSNPNVIFAAGNGSPGVFKSTNGGASWAVAGTGLPSSGFARVTIDPLASNVVYAGGSSFGLYKSVDGGASWALVSGVPTGSPLHGAAGSGAIFLEGLGVNKSTDGGSSWLSSDAGLHAVHVRKIIIDPTNAAVMYASSVQYGVSKSLDAGQTWATMNSGLFGVGMNALAIDPSNPATLYAGAGNSCFGVFKTTNAATSWSAASSGMDGQCVQSLVVDPQSPQTIYAATTNGVYKSTNGAATWVLANTGIDSTYASDLRIDPLAPSTLYVAVASATGLFKTINGGSSWAPANAGLPTSGMNTLAIDPINPARLFAWGSGQFTYRSTNGGATWTPTACPAAIALQVANDASGTLYVGPFNSENPLGSLFVSTDGGVTCPALQPASPAMLKRIEVSALALSTVTTGRIFAGTNTAGIYVLDRKCGDGAVDVNEQCDGGVTNGSAGSCCDGSCSFRAAGAQCRGIAGVCDLAEVCTGASGACPADGFAVGGLCRPSAGLCDVAESCIGTSAACPADQKSTAACRAVAGVCDLPESCDGVSNDCPADAFAGTGVTCRLSAGVCDVPDSCTGAGALCPADAKSTAPCRPSAGVCDVAESCDGAANDCPADVFQSATTICRSASGSCDVAETCTGTGTACPPDSGLPDGDGDLVCDAIDNCPSMANAGQENADGDGAGDSCDPCSNVGSSRNAVNARLTISKLATPPGDDSLTMAGTITIPTTPAIDPIHNGLRILLQDSAGNAVNDRAIPGGIYDNVAKFGWRSNAAGTAFTYIDKAGLTEYSKIRITGSASAPGFYKVKVTGKRGNFAVPVGSLPPHVTVVLSPPVSTIGQCGEWIFLGPPPAPSCSLKSGAIKCR